MYILPYIQIQKRTPGVQQFWLLLERNGTHLIEIESTESQDAIKYAEGFLQENELDPAAKPFCKKDIVYCRVKNNSPSLSNFYTWKETPPGTTPSREAWRTFLWTSSPELSDSWGVNQFMSSILLSDTKSGHNVFSVLSPLIEIP